jgi:hypothetical protein
MTKRRSRSAHGVSATPNWKQYEELAYRIVKELMPFADVKIDDKILGNESDQKRQIDISARWRYSGDDYLLIVQVKDHKRRAHVGIVGAFLSDIQDVGASRGILICSGGFTKGARAWAKSRGVSLYSLHDAASTAWSRELKIPFLWIDYEVATAMSFKFAATESFQATIRSDAPLINDDGRTVPGLSGLVEELWNNEALAREEGRHVYAVPGRWTMSATDELNRQRKLHNGRIEVIYTVRRNTWLAEYEPADCRGLIDYLDGEVFVPSRLSLSDVPVKRDDSWTRVDDPASVALKVRGILITADVFGVAPGSARVSRFQIFEIH